MKVKHAVWIGILVAILIGSCTTTYLVGTTPAFEFSEGSRVGVLRKLSNKGMMFKTWEGELMLNANMGALALDTFLFSVADDSIALELNKHLGETLELHYIEYYFVPYRVGDQSYIITDFTIK